MKIGDKVVLAEEDDFYPGLEVGTEGTITILLSGGACVCVGNGLYVLMFKHLSPAKDYHVKQFIQNL